MKNNNKLNLSFNNLPLIVQDLIIGRILGDSSLEITKGSINVRMTNNHSIKQKEYIFYIYQQLEEYCKTPPKLSSYVLKNKTYETYKFNTLNCKFFTELYNIFYINNKKSIPLNISEFLSPRALAFWTMDDGYKQGSSVVLCTDNFTKEEVELLINVLKFKFDLDCTLYLKNKIKGTYRIYIRSKSMNQFKDLVLPHFHSSMLYKIS
jgi:hypothetical protein